MSPSINHNTVSNDISLRPTQVKVDLKAIAGNVRAVRSLTGAARIMAVLKANAYGHGLLEVARLHQELGTEYLAVAFLEEALLLRQEGITMPILVLGGIIGHQIPHFIENDITITASSVGKLNQIEETAEKLGRRAKVHLKIDTGMERLGVHHYSAESLISAASCCRYTEIEGIFSHFADADGQDLGFARLQLQRFTRVLELFDLKKIDRPEYIHMASSGALVQLPDARFNMVRPGIMLYGVYPSEAVRRLGPELRPALSWSSRVVYFKVIRAGDTVGYGRTWKSDHDVRAVTVPVGYGDGYIRAMSGRARVLINGRAYPAVGRISMDQIVVNIEDDSAFNGDEAVLIGQQGESCITCEDLASWAGTIPYEILTNINTRVPRVYVH